MSLFKKTNRLNEQKLSELDLDLEFKSQELLVMKEEKEETAKELADTKKLMKENTILLKQKKAELDAAKEELQHMAEQEDKLQAVNKSNSEQIIRQSSKLQ